VLLIRIAQSENNCLMKESAYQEINNLYNTKTMTQFYKKIYDDSLKRRDYHDNGK